MSTFDAVKHTQTTEQQWQDAAEAWHRKKAAWDEIAQELTKFEGPNGFEGPREMLVAVGVN